MLKRMRDELRLLMADIPARRPPALRRSDAPDMLLATDLPLLTGMDALAVFLSRLDAADWRYRIQGQWLLLDHEPPVPPVCPGPLHGEAACVALLLEKHPGGGSDPELLRRLLKAAEQGPRKTEPLMEQLHGRLAGMLRQKQPLPDGLLPYIRYAAQAERSPQ